MAFEKEFTDVFRNIKGVPEDEWGVHLDYMSEDGVWGTDVEISAFATLMSIEMWTYLDGAWCCYRPRFLVDENNERKGLLSPIFLSCCP